MYRCLNKIHFNQVWSYLAQKKLEYTLHHFIEKAKSQITRVDLDLSPFQDHIFKPENFVKIWIHLALNLKRPITEIFTFARYTTL